MGWEYHTEVFDFSKAFFSMGGLFDSEKFNIEVNRLGWENWELTFLTQTETKAEPDWWLQFLNVL